jgi:hypothetical protein
MSHSDLHAKFENLTKAQINDAFLDQCRDGDIDALDYLFHLKKFKKNTNSFNKFGAVLEAAENKHIHIIKYLVTSTYLKDDYLPYVQNKYVLDAIRRNDDIPMITYLILELNIEKTEFMQDFLEHSNTAYRDIVANLFHVRELSAGLKEELDTTNKTINKKIKI